MKNGQIREPIRFHAGLNAVLGDDNGSNSIGKSTFLMILDFVFGGSDYVKKCTDVQENVKGHTINFTFEFAGKKYHFSRNTIDYNKIIRCDSDYQPLEDEPTLSIQQYGNFLCDQYGLSAEGITWRGAILKDATHLPPVLRLEKLNKYNFKTPNDGGTGAQYRGLITFDLANMVVAPVPFVVHDSVLLKNIERPVFSAIMQVYAEQKNKGKQVFMAYDTLDSYGYETRKLLEANAVLELSPGGNELFGWA